MNPFQANPRMSRTIRLFGFTVIVAMIVVALISIMIMRDREIDAWRRQMSSMSLMLAEQTSQTIVAAYLILDVATEHVRELGVSDQTMFRTKLATPDVHQMLRGRIEGLPQIDVASIVAANGDNINFTRSYPVPTINLAERDYFKAHRDNPNVGDFISQPVRNKGNGKWTFYISRRLNDAQGNFMGLVLVGLSVESLVGLYERVVRDMGEGTAINLYRQDMMLLTRWPHRDELIGQINRSGSSHELVTVQKKMEGQIFTDSPRFSTGERVLRLTAVRKTERYPLIVSLTVTDDLLLANWRRSAFLIAGITALAVLTLLGGLLVLSRNVKRREEDMMKMERLKTEAEEANLAKSKFLATMSHEIRTPMNGVLGMAQMLLMENLTEEERRDYARTILTSGQTLLTLLNEILDISKIEAGKLELAHVVFDPHQMVEHTAALFAEQALSKGLRIEAVPDRFGGQRYLADPIRLRQMLTNLVGNAIKFTTQGFVRIDAAEIDRKGRDALLEFVVTDSGIGIAQDKQHLLFKPFSQVDSSSTRGYGGTGLGLSVVSSLAKLMGGDAGVESEEGKGSRFWFRIRAEALPPEEQESP